MNNKEAIGQLFWVQKRICDITYSPESFEAINIAIEALEERPKGEWIKTMNGSICGVCGCIRQQMYDAFCSNCGADMRKEADNDK